MVRPRRIEVPDGIYHVMNRFVGGQKFFRTDADIELFLNEFMDAADRLGVRILVYCCMPNHFHAVVHTLRPNLSTFLQKYSTNFARKMNRRLKRVGHLFQGRHRTKLIDGEDYFNAVIAYVLLNPVRAGLVKWCEDYKWSSLSRHIKVRKRSLMDVKTLLEEYPDLGTSRAGFVDWLNGLDVEDNRATMQTDGSQFLMEDDHKRKILRQVNRRKGERRPRQEARRTDWLPELYDADDIDRWIDNGNISGWGGGRTWRGGERIQEHFRWWCYRELSQMTYEGIRRRRKLPRHTIVSMAIRRIRSDRLKLKWVSNNMLSIKHSIQPSKSEANV